MPFQIRSRRWAMAAGVVAHLAAALEAQTPFKLPVAGCPMAHCDAHMSDNVNTAIPVGPAVEVLFHDPAPAGAGSGLAQPTAP
jgi:phosphoribosylcarboxyaminoimidazole (NCAIR) mutase